MSLWVKIFLAIFIIIALGAGTIVYKGLSFERNISISSKDTSIFKQIQNMVTKSEEQDEKDTIKEMNILLLGIAGKGHEGSELTDTIIILMIRPKENRIALLSIPRDLYIKVPELNLGYTKINAVYTYGNQYQYEEGGIGLIKKTLTQITGITIDNYVLMDFDGFTELVDILGGVQVDNKEDIYDTAYPGPDFTYQTFKLKKGVHTLDGKTALKYVRTRHSAGGDFNRARRQQDVLQAIKDKLLALHPIFDLGKINKILDTLGEHIKTDLSIEQMRWLYSVYQDTFEIFSVVVDADLETGILIESKEPLGNAVADVLKPRLGEDNFSEFQELTSNVFQYDSWKSKRKQLREEKASIEIRYAAQDFESATLTELTTELTKFGYTVFTKQVKASELSESSIIYDLAKGTKPASLEDLKNKLNTKTSIALGTITSNADFVVFLKN